MTDVEPPAEGSDWSAVAARLADAVTAVFGSQRAAAAACGVGQSAVSKTLSGRVRPSAELLRALALRGVDVSAILAGLQPTLAAVPRFGQFLFGPPGAAGVDPSGLFAAPVEFVVPGAYAVRIDTATAEAVLGGEHADRPRAGDTLVVMTDAAAAVRLAEGRSPSAAGRTAVVLPPPVVLLHGAPVLSFLHVVRLAGSAEDVSLRDTLWAERVEPATASAPTTPATLRAVGYVVHRSGPIRPLAGRDAVLMDAVSPRRIKNPEPGSCLTGADRPDP